MSTHSIKFQRISSKLIPMSLLLLSDPKQSHIEKYLQNAQCFAAFIDEQIVSSCIINTNIDGQLELFNIASLENKQGQGIGSKLLQFVISELHNNNEQELVLGTGTFGHQLTFYQRLGFRVTGIIKNFFIDHYETPIYENGLQHYDMLRLSVKL